MVTEHEEWRAVIGYEGIYEVSDLGRVRSLPRSMPGRWSKGRVLRPAPGRYGHMHMVLCKPGRKNRTVRVHQVVLEAFVGPRPPSMEGAHWDGDPSNNRLDNLRWATAKENREDSARHGTLIRGEHHRLAKLCPSDVGRIRELRKTGRTYRSIASEFGVSHTLVIRIMQGSAWPHMRESV